MLLAEALNTDWIAGIAAILTALGGIGGIRSLIKRLGRLIDAAEQLEAKSKKFDEVTAKIDEVCDHLANHSVRMQELERSKVAFNEFETLLHRQDAHLFATTESLDYGAWVSDDHGLCIHCNTALTVLMMCSRDQIIGNSWRDMLHPEDRDSVVAKWMDFVRGERASFSAKYRFVSPDGKVQPVIGTAVRPTIKGVKSDRIFGWAKPNGPRT